MQAVFTFKLTCVLFSDKTLMALLKLELSKLISQKLLCSVRASAQYLFVYLSFSMCLFIYICDKYEGYLDCVLVNWI